MKIKRVDILGFKSFVDKASLDFEAGVTAVLGPNGCGKSNIVDAIRWAMGEQNAKNLRGRAMEDVIFGGSETRKPLGMAEVSMIFSNADGQAPPAYKDYAEIMVTRRLFRNGESEYLINKTPCRLKDITELFMDTGVGARAYSIIEQGKIGMILSAKPEDRRFLIEEAAGVTKYKSRKKTALRKIEATRQNLVRLNDVISEVRRQAGSLKRQAQKAQRFRDCRQELRDIETRFGRHRFAELREQIAASDSQQQELQRSLAELDVQFAQQGLKAEEMRLLNTAAEQDVLRLQEQVFHLGGEIQRVEGGIEVSAKERAGLERQKERLTTEKEDFARRLQEHDLEDEQLRQERVSLDGNLAREIRQLSQGELALDELAGQEREATAALEGQRSALFAALTELSRIGSFHDEAQRRMKAVAERSCRNRSEAVGGLEQSEATRCRIDALGAELEGIRQCRAGLQHEHARLREQVQVSRQSLERNEASLLVRREEFYRSRSRLESLAQLEESFEGYGRGVRTLLGDPAMRERFGSMVADSLEVPARYEAAVEAVLTDRLQALVALRAEDVRQAATLLRQDQGRCTFVLPWFAVPAARSFSAGEALVDLVSGFGEVSDLVQRLLGGVFLVSDLEPYLEAGLAQGVTLVTEAGELLTSRGEYTGGGRQDLDRGVLHKKREIKELTLQVQGLGRDVDGLQAQRSELRRKLEGCEEQLREVEAALHRKELRGMEGEKDLARLAAEAERFDERLEVLSLEEEQLHEEQEQLCRQQAETNRRRQQLEQQKLESEERVAALQDELQVLRRDLGVVREQVTAGKVTLAKLREREEGVRSALERLGRQREDLQGRLVGLDGGREEAEQGMLRLRQEKSRLDAELEALVTRRTQQQARLDALRKQFEADAEKIAVQDELAASLRSRQGQNREALGARQLKTRELQIEIEHLQQRFIERYRVDLAAKSQPPEAHFDSSAAERRRAQLRRQLDTLGDVNLTAIEEFQELEERERFLAAQQADLSDSLDGLQQAISKINRTTRVRFRETFEQINATFRGLFPRLFSGGQAELRLIDEQDLLESGIDIVAQPPGKKLQNVSLLSGGEKALTAVALVFSIFMIKPSPFCVLDEVDAPLDEANIGRFNELVKEMAQASQFIIITHNKRTMEVADTLYGVTMEDPGASTLVSVRMNEYL